MATCSRSWHMLLIVTLLAWGCQAGVQATGAKHPLVAPSAAVQSASAPNGLVLGATGQVVAVGTPTVAVGNGVLGSHGAALTGVLLGPASLVGDNGGGVISNNGGSIVSNNSSSYRLAGAGSITATEQPVANTRVRLLDAAGRAVLDANGHPLEAISDAQGRYAFPSVQSLAFTLVAVAELPAGRGTLQALVSQGQAPAAGVKVDLVSTLTTTYILERYVRNQTKDPIATLNKLPGEVEAETRLKAASALDLGTVPIPTDLASQTVVATVDALRAKNGDFDAQMQIVQKLLVIGLASDAGTDGPALTAIVEPAGVVVGADGTIYFTEGEGRPGIVRSVSLDGQVHTWVDEGVNGRLKSAHGVVPDGHGSLYVVDSKSHQIDLVGPDGKVSVFAGSGVAGHADGQRLGASFNLPQGIVRDPAGNLYVADTMNDLIRKISPDGVVSTYAGGAEYPNESDDDSNVTFGSGGISVDGQGAGAEFGEPVGLALDAAGNLYVTDYHDGKVRKIAPDRTVTTLAGGAKGAQQDGQGAAASFEAPVGLAIDRAGTLYVADGDRLRKVTPDGLVSTLAAGQFPADNETTTARFTTLDFALYFEGAGLLGVWCDGNDNVVVADNRGNALKRVHPDGTIEAIAGTGLAVATGDGASHALLGIPRSLAFTPAGDVYVSDSFTKGIWKVSTSGDVSNYAGPSQASGDLPPTHAVALNGPAGLDCDAAGNLYVADAGARVIRKLAPDGTATIVAGGAVTVPPDGRLDGRGAAAAFINPTELVAGPAGVLYVTDAGSLRKVAADGTVTTVAGGAPEPANGAAPPPLADGPALEAYIYSVGGVVLEPDGNLFISDPSNHAIRRLGMDGRLVTVAGGGPAAHRDGIGRRAGFTQPEGMTSDAAQNLYVVDAGTIRRITPAGVVTTLDVKIKRSLGSPLRVQGHDLWYADGNQLLSLPL